MILICGLGGECHRDQGFGLSIAYRLAKRYADSDGMVVRRFVDSETLDPENLPDFDRLILIDASARQQEPGLVHHYRGIDDAIAARDLGYCWHRLCAPLINRPGFLDHKTVDVILVEGAQDGFGVALSPRVAEAADEVIFKIDRLVGKEKRSYRSSGPKLRLVARNDAAE